MMRVINLKQLMSKLYILVGVISNEGLASIILAETSYGMRLTIKKYKPNLRMQHSTYSQRLDDDAI